MKPNRRQFISTALAGGAAAAALPQSSLAAGVGRNDAIRAKYAKLDAILKQPVLRRELFTSPVIIETLELLRFNNNFLCRVRSKDGAEGISAANNSPMLSVWPIHVNRLQNFFLGKDARDLEAVMAEAYVHQSNYKLQSLALWVPMATIEFAILDLLGRIAKQPLGLLISDTIYNPMVKVYRANGERDNSAEEVMANLTRQVEESQAKALKIKIGGRMEPCGSSRRSLGKLIPMVRKKFGDQMVCYADSNGSYDVAEAIKFGKLLQEYKYAFYEEPVPFDWYEETKAVADAVDIPLAGGEQEASMHAFRWLIANDGVDIAQPDVYYFGGLIRSMRVARMAAAMNKTIVPHISGGLGYLYMVHFVSSIANAGEYHEFKGLTNPASLPFECKTSTLKTDGGVVTVPTGPGSGIEIDPDFIKKHTVLQRDRGRAEE